MVFNIVQVVILRFEMLDKVDLSMSRRRREQWTRTLINFLEIFMSLRTALPRRNFLTQTSTLAVVTLAAIASPPFAFAYDDKSSSQLNLDAQGVALKGYDPVSYFLAAGPLQGNATLSERHEGATYLFANPANLDAFKANPAKYVPAFGGFCAMGAVMDKKLDIDPQLWRVVDGRLYLNVHKPAQTRWLEDTKGNIEKGEKNWSRIKDKVPNTL